jgi:hypothetical protein
MKKMQSFLSDIRLRSELMLFPTFEERYVKTLSIMANNNYHQYGYNLQLIR